MRTNYRRDEEFLAYQRLAHRDVSRMRVEVEIQILSELVHAHR